jgi:hypothetical protein
MPQHKKVKTTKNSGSAKKKDRITSPICIILSLFSAITIAYTESMIHSTGYKKTNNRISGPGTPSRKLKLSGNMQIMVGRSEIPNVTHNTNLDFRFGFT